MSNLVTVVGLAGLDAGDSDLNRWRDPGREFGWSGLVARPWHEANRIYYYIL